MTDRYRVTGSQGEFQPGSDGLVLANKLGITVIDDINDVELALLNQLYFDVLINNLPDHQLSVGDIKAWHRRWLGNVYEWAGQERSVNMSKGGFAFAAVGQIPRLLTEFERSCLQRWTPCHNMSTADLLEAVAVTHVEVILIHPFREGNGRLARLLADVMVVQAGRETSRLQRLGIAQGAIYRGNSRRTSHAIRTHETLGCPGDGNRPWKYQPANLIWAKR
jgi:cell filamentation protein